MESECDALRDYVLPQVNEFASKYGRAVEIIDLRWGVDTDSVSEEEQNHKVLRTCLDEIERSRPFFSGNVWEWCWDWQGYYTSTTKTNPTGPFSGGDYRMRVIRGGSWYDSAGYTQSVYRHGLISGFRFYDLGFRVSRS